jgi:hypothetical protein
VAEGGGLLNRYTAITRIVGSNPIPSATPGKIFRNINKVIAPTGKTHKYTRDPALDVGGSL